MTQEEQDQCMREGFEAEAEFYRACEKSLNEAIKQVNHKDARNEIEYLLDGCRLNGNVTIVDRPAGDDQCQINKAFTKVFVDQYSRGDSGDSFDGYIYAQFAEGKWLKIPYDC